MDILWAPWRAKYISDTTKAKSIECLFCKISKENNHQRNKIEYRSTHTLAVLNSFTYKTWHVILDP